MEPSLSLVHDHTGSGLECPKSVALKSVTKQLGTAHVQSGLTPGLNKREAKALSKQYWENLVEENKFYSNCLEDKEQIIFEQEMESDSKNVANSPPIHKRRKLTEDSNDCNLSQNSNYNFSTQSNLETLRKVHSYNQDTKKNKILEDQDQQCPMMKKRRSKEVSGNMKLLKAENTWLSNKAPQNSSSGGSLATSFDEKDSHSRTLSIAHFLCSTFEGKLRSQEVLSGRGGNKGLSFECWNKHQFIISLSTLNRLKTISVQNSSCYDSWCLKCRNFLLKTMERAKETNSSIISSSINKGHVEVKCNQEHIFIVNYTTNHSKIWCEQCKNEESKKKQDFCKEREKHEEIRKQREQQRLFQESLKHMQEKEQKQNMSFSSTEESHYFENTMKQVCNYAKTKMERETSHSDYKGKASTIEIYNVYKVLYMPEDILIKTFLMIERSQLNSYFRKLALLLHPDKNNHAKANDAFLKLQAIKNYVNNIYG
jgi:hypothetical protein